MPHIQASALAEKYETYDTAEKAAIAGLRSIKEKHVEIGGGVLFNPATGKYTYTAPVGQNDGAHFSAAVQVPQGWAIKGMFHTHPVGPQSTFFSDDDISSSQRLKIPSYVLPHYSGKIIRFDPASTAVSKSVQGRFSKGDSVDEAPAANAGPDVPDRPVAEVPASGGMLSKAVE